MLRLQFLYKQLLFTLSLYCLSATALYGQDPVFSQFYAAPLQLNPAFAGTGFAPRIALNYRNQWLGINNAYTTYSASYEQSLEQLNSGIGIVAMSDVAGDGIYKTNQFSAIYAYNLQVNRNIGIKFGLQGGYTQNTIDWNRLVFPDQIDPVTGITDPSGNPFPSNEEQPINLSNGYFDVSAGLLAYSELFYGGISIKHLNTPDENILGINENLSDGLPMRLTLHGGVQISLNHRNNRGSQTFISPNVMYIKQGDFGQVTAGAYFKSGLFFAGGWYRHTFENPDAAIISAGVEYQIFKIGYSYDLTVSEFANASNAGTHELSFIIDLDKSESAQRRRQSARYNDCLNMFR